MIFAAAVTTAVAWFSVGVVSAANTQSEKYAVPAGGTVYDNSYAKIEIGSEGKIYRSWNKGYNLVDDNKKEYSLGRQTVAYDPGAKSLTVYGGGYRFYPDGTVERLDSRYEITDLSEPAFYKLTDRLLLLGDILYHGPRNDHRKRDHRQHRKPSDRRLGIYGGRPLRKCPCDERPS